MEIFTLLSANLRRHKGSLTGIFLLVLMAAAVFETVLSVWTNTGAYVRGERSVRVLESLPPGYRRFGIFRSFRRISKQSPEWSVLKRRRLYFQITGQTAWNRTARGSL